jgi:hypothetical protein
MMQSCREVVLGDQRGAEPARRGTPEQRQRDPGASVAPSRSAPRRRRRDSFPREIELVTEGMQFLNRPHDRSAGYRWQPTGGLRKP